MSLNKFPNLLFVSSVKNDGNMSFKRGNPKNALRNRRKFLKSLGLTLDSIVGMAPYHSNKIAKVAKKDLGKGARELSKKIPADALITNEKGTFLFVTTGDCLPVAFFDPKSEAICLAHAGWEGLDKDIINNVVLYFKQNYKTSPKDLFAQIGPSIGPCCYTLKETPSQLKNPKWKKSITKNGQTYSIDLWDFANRQFLKSGLLKENIFNRKICTFHTNKYYSHRKFTSESLPQDSRFATILGIKHVS